MAALWLDANGLEGTLPPEAISPLTSLAMLSVAGNEKLRGELPTDAIELMQKLRRLGIRSHFWI